MGNMPQFRLRPLWDAICVRAMQVLDLLIKVGSLLLIYRTLLSR